MMLCMSEKGNFIQEHGEAHCADTKGFQKWNTRL